MKIRRFRRLASSVAAGLAAGLILGCGTQSPKMPREAKPLRPAADSRSIAASLKPAPHVLEPVLERVKRSMRWGSDEERATAVRQLGRMGEHALPLLQELSHDRSWEVCRDAAKALGLVKSPAAVPLLGRLSADKNWSVRLAAVLSLRETQDPEADSFLAKAASDPIWRIRREAALSYHPSRTAELRGKLLELARDPDLDIRLALARALPSQSQRSDSERETLKVFLEDAEWRVREAAIAALDPLPNAGLIDGLRRRLSDPEPTVRRAALLAIAAATEEIPEKGAEVLEAAFADALSADPQESERALAFFEELCHRRSAEARIAFDKWLNTRDSIPPQAVLQILLKPDSLIGWEQPGPVWIERLCKTGSPDQRSLALPALRSLGRDLALEIVRQACDDPSSEVRVVAIEILEKDGAEQDGPRLLSLTVHPDPSTRRVAILALLECSRSTLEERVPELLENERDPQVLATLLHAIRTNFRGTAICDSLLALYRRRTVSSMQVFLLETIKECCLEEARIRALLEETLDEPHTEAAALAVRLLDDYLPEEKFLQLAQTHNSIAVRREAIRVLSFPRSPPVRDLLLGLVRDPNAEIRTSAAQALASWPGEELLPLLLETAQDPSAEVQMALVEAVVREGGRDGAKFLGEFLRKTSEQSLRPYLVSLLCAMQESDSEELLLKLFYEEATPSARSAYVLGFAGLGTVEAAPGIREQLKEQEPFLLGNALEALEALADTASAPLAVNLLGHSDASVRSHACRFLGRLREDRSREGLLQNLYDDAEDVRQEASLALLRLGHQEDTQLALDALDQLSEARAGCWSRGFIHAAQTLRENGFLALAEEQYVHSLDEPPYFTDDLGWPHRKAGEMALERLDFEAAVRHFEAALKPGSSDAQGEDPAETLLLVALGLRGLSAGRENEARDLFDKAMGISREKAATANLIAWCATEAKLVPALATKYAEVALRLAPAEADIWDTAAWAAYRSKDFGAAWEIFENLRKEPSPDESRKAGSLPRPKAEYFLHSSLVWLALGDRTMCLGDLKQAFRRDPYLRYRVREMPEFEPLYDDPEWRRQVGLPLHEK